MNLSLFRRGARCLVDTQALADDPQRWVVLCSGYELGSHPRSWGPNVRALLKPFELEELEHLLESIHTALASAAG